MHLGLLFPDLTSPKSDLKALYTKHPSHRCVLTGIVPVPGSRIIFFGTYPVTDGAEEARHDLRVVLFVGKIGRITACQLESCAAKTQRICDFDRERFFFFKGTVGEIPWIFY